MNACGTTKKAATAEEAPAVIVAPEGITFTTVKDYKQFASIQIPVAGSGFNQQGSMSYNDAGEEVPTGKFYNAHIKTWSNFSNDSYIRKLDMKDDVNQVFETMKTKGAYGLKSYLKQENVIEEYEDVIINGKTCKRYFLAYEYTAGNYYKYIFGYIIPYNETTVWIALDHSKETELSMVREHVATLDIVFKYMISTVEFRE